MSESMTDRLRKIRDEIGERFKDRPLKDLVGHINAEAEKSDLYRALKAKQKKTATAA